MRFTEHWTWCTVTALRDLTPDIREFVLQPDSGVAQSWPPGSHIHLSVLIDGRPERRSYSLVGDGDGRSYRIAVRRAPDGRGGSRAMHALGVGSRIEISNPSSLFNVDWSAGHYGLIAGGIGITPMLGIASALLRRNADVHLHYAVRSARDAAYRDDLAAMLGDRLTVHTSGDGQRLDLEAVIAALPANAAGVICGPMRMLESVRTIWHDHGRPAERLHFETFGSSGRLPATEFRIRVAGSEAEIVVPPNRSMLDALNEAGQEIISDCLRGECGVCAIDVVAVDGEIDHRDVFFSDRERTGGRKICPCVSRARGTVTVDTLYRPNAA